MCVYVRTHCIHTHLLGTPRSPAHHTRAVILLCTSSRAYVYMDVCTYVLTNTTTLPLHLLYTFTPSCQSPILHKNIAIRRLHINMCLVSFYLFLAQRRAEMKMYEGFAPSWSGERMPRAPRPLHPPQTLCAGDAPLAGYPHHY